MTMLIKLTVVRSDSPIESGRTSRNLIYTFRSRQKKLIINYPTNITIILEKMNDHLVYFQDSIQYTNIREKYYLIARFGLIFMVLKGWTDSGMKESPEDLINYLMSLILAI